VQQAISAGQVKAALAAYFAIIGALSPYLGLYLDSLGLAASQIALLLALPQATRIFAPPMWGWLADHYRKPALILQVSAVVMVISVVLLPFAKASVLGIGAVLLLFYIFSAAQMPLVEACAIAVSKGHAGLYGDMRVWGSIGFIVTVVVFGPLLDVFGYKSLPMGLGVLCVVLLVICSKYSTLPAAGTAATVKPIGPQLRQPVVIWVFTSCMLHVLAHSGLYAFLSLFLARQGYSGMAIGALWAIGVLTEIIWFKVQQRYFVKFSSLSILIFCAAVAVVRFGALGALDGAGQSLWVVATLVLLQASHAFTFAAHHTAAMNKMHEWFDSGQQSRAQSLFVAWVYGVGGSVGAILSGQLWEKMGPAWVFYGAAIASFLALLAGLVAHLIHRRR
jgi:MFS transporter, PPP family, 3-phenylpropionic acid transporter